MQKYPYSVAAGTGVTTIGLLMLRNGTIYALQICETPKLNLGHTRDKLCNRKKTLLGNFLKRMSLLAML